MKGQASKTLFCKQYKELTVFQIQGSINTTSEEIIDIFRKGRDERDGDRTYYALSFEPGQTRRLTINRGPFERGRTYRLSVVTRDNYVYLDDRYLVRLRAGDAPPAEEGLVPTPAAPTPAGQKVLIDGTLYIISNGLRYNAQGMRMR